MDGKLALELSYEQEKMLRGERGDAVQLAMEILTKEGESAGADALVPIRSAHVQAHYGRESDNGLAIMEKFAGAGGRFAVPTTVEPLGIDLENWRRFGVPNAFAEKQLRLRDAYARLGGIPCWTCVQYQVCNFPKKGEAVAWSGSSSVVFANSLIGCRTNRMKVGLDLACAVTGLTPRCGMLVDENRTAKISFKIELDRIGDLDYRTMGFFIGKIARARVPALEGLPPSVTSDHLKHLGASAATAGPVDMIHYVGVTPQSETLQRATGGDAAERIGIGRRELEEVEKDLDQTDEKPDLVALGTPHLSVNELGQVERLLQGRKLLPGIRMFVYTSSEAYALSEMSGIRRGIERAGGRLSHTTDGEISPLRQLGFKIVATDSAKMASSVAEDRVKVSYKPLNRIIEEVTRK